MKKLVSLMFVLSLALGLSGCSWVDKVKSKFKGKKKADTEQTEKKSAKASKKADKKMKKGEKKVAATGGKKRVRCSMKKTYEKSHACWHWKRGARIGKPGYNGKKEPQEVKEEEKKEEKK